jgi:hypothetical protein
MGTVIYNKELLLKTRKILLNKKILYKNINISCHRSSSVKKTNYFK